MAKITTEQSQPKDNSQVNICGVLVQTKPEKANFVAQTLTGISGVDVHHQTDNGQIVITIEDTRTRFASDIITEVNGVDGVLVASLVYHQCENLSDMSKELVL